MVERHECKDLPEDMEIYQNYDCGMDTSTYYWDMKIKYKEWIEWDDDGYTESEPIIKSITMERIKFCPYCGTKLE